MKTVFFTLLTFIICASAVMAQPGAAKQADSPIAVVRLADGRVLKNVTFGKAGAEVIAVRSSNSGTLGLRYDALPDDVRAIAEQRRPGGAKWFAGDTSANTEAIAGQVFISTQGAGAHKFSGVEVYAFDLSLLQNFDHPSQGVVRLPRPIHKATTDADGKFTIKVPADRAYFLFAQASRLRVSGPDSWTERFEWRVPMSAVRKGQQLNLSADFRFEQSRIQIDE